MRPSSVSGTPRLVLRFAVYAAIVLVVALAAALPLARNSASSGARANAARDAQLVAELLSRMDLARLAFQRPAKGSTVVFLDDFFYGNVGSARAAQVVLFNRDGRVTYSTNRALVATHGDEASIARTLAGRTVQQVTAGAVGGPRKVLRSYVPVQSLTNRSAQPIGVLAVDEDYGPVASRVQSEFLRQAATTGVALLVLYLVLLPLMRRMTATLRAHNRRLNDQAAELERSLGAEQAAANAARASESRYRALTEQASDAIFVCDAAGSVAELNEKASELVGRTAGDACGRPFADVVGAAGAELSFDALGPRESLTAEHRLHRADGTAVDGELRAARLDDGRILVSVRDVTERNRLEAEVRESHKLDAVGRLAEGVSHEFNNLLTAIGGQSDLLLDRLDTGDPLRHGAEEIKKASEQGMAFAKRLLGFSSSRVGPVEAVDLGDLLSSTEKLLRRLVGENIELVVRCDAPASVLADRAGLERVLVNLVADARGRLTHGGRIVVDTAHAPGRFVVVQVSDSGGAAFDEHGAHSVLAAARAFAEDAGGSVVVESAPGLGTTYVLCLPRIQASAPALPAAATGPAEGSERILIVEDEEVVRAVMRQFLERQGYDVLAAGDAEQALRLCKEQSSPIDLLVTDMVLPGLDGTELAKQVQALAGPELAVLFTSGYPEDSEIVRAIAGRGLAFLQKPFTRDDFVRRVRDVLDGPRLRVAA